MLPALSKVTPASGYDPPSPLAPLATTTGLPKSCRSVRIEFVTTGLAGSTTSANGLVAVLPAESVTCTGKTYVFAAAETAVDDRTPPADSANPAGSGLKNPG